MLARRVHAQKVVEKRAGEMELEMAKTEETEATRLVLFFLFFFFFFLFFSLFFLLQIYRLMSLYQQQLREYWLEQKRLIATKIERESYDYTAQWTLKIARLKRKWQRQTYKRKEEDAERVIVQEKEDIRWEETWYFKIQAGVEEEAKRVLQLLETGGSGNQADKDKSKAIRTLVQGKAAEIKQRFRSSGVPLTDAESRVKAKKIAQETYSAATKIQLEKDRETDRIAVAERRQLELEAKSKENGFLNLTLQKHALHIVQGNIRKYAARQEVKRRIRFNYRKEFSPEHLCYFYQHRNNGTFRWDKPGLLGRSDLPAPKRWYHIRDTSFEPGASYWLKPRTAEMTFEVSKCNATMCSKHPAEFAVRYCADCTVTLCEPCYIGKPNKFDTDTNVPIIVDVGNVLKNHRKHNAVELDTGMQLKRHEVMCDACKFVLPFGKCSDCTTFYCNICFRSYHENSDYPEYQSHTLDMLDEETQAIVDDIKEKISEARLSHI